MTKQRARCLLFVIALILSIQHFVLAGSSKNKPNILFILTDDQRWDTLGCYGNEVIRTPNLDLLASEGARLDAFYVAAPLCCPSRAVFLSGLYPHQTGIYSNFDFPDLKEGTETVATYLNQAGYVTGFIGKAHLGKYPYKWHFTTCPVFLPGWGTGHKDPTLFVGGRRTYVHGYVTEIFTDEAIDFLEKYKNDRWFLWFAPTAPHIPYLEDSRHDYPKTMIKPPPGWPPQQPFPARFQSAEYRWVGDWSDYYATVSMLDEQVGRILRKLEELNLTRDTFVFVTSDNGDMQGSHNEPEKSVWYEESIRVPALARWPGKIKKGTVVPGLLSSADFVPTLIELAALPPDENLEGRSMLPALTAGRTVRQDVFAEVKREEPTNSEIWRMVRTDRWKYVRAETGEFLFDLRNDPVESSNLAALSADAEILKMMQSKMDSWLQQTPSRPPELSHYVRFVLRWLHVLASILWIGGMYFSAFLIRRIRFLSSAGESSHTNLVLTQSILVWNLRSAMIALLTGMALFCVQYLYPDRLLLMNENGITVRGILIFFGMTLGFVQWLSTFFILTPICKKLSQGLDDSSIRRISTVFRVNVFLSLPTLLCMLAASREIGDDLAKTILILVILALGGMPLIWLKSKVPSVE